MATTPADTALPDAKPAKAKGGFGKARAPHGKMFAFGYKANLEPVSLEATAEEWATIVIPFTNFTDFWDDATGDAIQTCHDNALYCPDGKALSNLKTIAVWGEGVAGKLSLEIQSLSAVGCTAGHANSTTDTVAAAHTLPDLTWFTRHMLRGWSQQVSLSTLFFNWSWIWR